MGDGVTTTPPNPPTSDIPSTADTTSSTTTTSTTSSESPVTSNSNGNTTTSSGGTSTNDSTVSGTVSVKDFNTLLNYQESNFYISGYILMFLIILTTFIIGKSFFYGFKSYVEKFF